ncbi:MAG: exodeoxyribonuclease III [Nevskiaceae bacterium]
MKIASWNVNSLRVRLPHLLDWLKVNPVDVIGLQELKLQDDQFPHAELQALGYHAVANGQKTYNGVALLSRAAPAEVVRDLPNFDDDNKRLIAATFGDVRVISAYVPNGQSVGSDKYAYKLRWLQALAGHLAGELASFPKLAIVGDFNVAPTDADVHDPVAWDGQVLCSEPERGAFRALLALGLTDAFTLFPRPAQSYTWWDYRMGAFRRNLGLRIDHALLSPALSEKCSSFQIDTAPRRLERPSDHAPFIAHINP